MLNLKDIQTKHWIQTIGIFSTVLGLIWTLVLALSLIWNLSEQQRVLKELALIIARTSFQKDVLYRSWNAGHGGVYVPVTEQTQPNPYLNDFPGQNIETTDGKLYTLINPAYMSRQVFELQKNYTGVIGHITSLNPVRPENAADLWEQSALLSFEEGKTEYYSIETLNGEPHLRYMSPLMVEQRCLVCHATQGYEIGEVRGGISESVPLLPLKKANQSFTIAILLGHLTIWGGGIAGLFYFSTNLHASLKRQAIAEKKLVEMSTYDGLTGVYTRGYFEETLKQIGTIQGKPISILSADVDNLKLTNDQFGHEAGDRLLKRAADVLRDSFRETDFVARTGGDEFIIILPDTGKDKAATAMERVRESIERVNMVHPGEPLHISLGIATADRETSIEEALVQADQHMYANKAEYKRNLGKSGESGAPEHDSSEA